MQHHALKAETIFASRINLTLASPWDFLNIRETNDQGLQRFKHSLTNNLTLKGQFITKIEFT